MKSTHVVEFMLDLQLLVKSFTEKTVDPIGWFVSMTSVDIQIQTSWIEQARTRKWGLSFISYNSYFIFHCEPFYAVLWFSNMWILVSVQLLFIPRPVKQWLLQLHIPYGIKSLTCLMHHFPLDTCIWYECIILAFAWNVCFFCQISCKSMFNTMKAASSLSVKPDWRICVIEGIVLMESLSPANFLPFDFETS